MLEPPTKCSIFFFFCCLSTNPQADDSEFSIQSHSLLQAIHERLVTICRLLCHVAASVTFQSVNFSMRKRLDNWITAQGQKCLSKSEKWKDAHREELACEHNVGVPTYDCSFPPPRHQSCSNSSVLQQGTKTDHMLVITFFFIVDSTTRWPYQTISERSNSSPTLSKSLTALLLCYITSSISGNQGCTQPRIELRGEHIITVLAHWQFG